MVLSSMLLGMVNLNFWGMELVQAFSCHFISSVFSQTSFATVILAVLKRGEILGKSRVQQGLKHGHLHFIILCCSSVFNCENNINNADKK